MRIATWNVNHRVGRTTYRAEAANAACAAGADVVCFNEFYPKHNEATFRAVLSEAGYGHQLISESAPAGVAANRVLIASRLELEPVKLNVPTHEPHLPTNVLGARVSVEGITVVALRVPAYDGVQTPHLLAAWEWVASLAQTLVDEPAVILGDLNVSLDSLGYQRGKHLKEILKGGWVRVATSGPTYFGHKGVRSEIDHILVTKRCVSSNASVLAEVDGFALCGSPDAISDHCILMCDVTAAP